MQIEDIGEGKTKPFCAPVLLNRSFHTYYNISLPVMQYLMPFLLLVILYSRLGFHLLERNIPGNKEQKRDLVALREKKRVLFCFKSYDYFELKIAFFMKYLIRFI